jgi:hypothetical protein
MSSGGLCPLLPTCPGGAPASDRGYGTRVIVVSDRGWNELFLGADLGLALALLVARVLADDHDPAVPADHPALVADPLDARLDLHVAPDQVLLVAVDDAPAGEVVRRKLDDDPVLGEDADVVLPHLAADVSQHLVTISELYAEHCIRQGLDHSAFDFDGSVFLGHVLRYLTSGSWGRLTTSYPDVRHPDQPRLPRSSKR